MKKFLYGILGMSLIGASLSFLLLWQHFYPLSNLAQASCIVGGNNSCMELALSDYSAIFGIPIASIGLFFYLFIIFAILLADYAEGIYTKAVLFISLLLFSLALIIDIVLVVSLVMTKQFCFMCILTYLVNIVSFTILIIWVRYEKNNNGLSLKLIFKDIRGSIAVTNEGKAAIASFTMFSFLLFFALLATSQILNLHPDANRDKIVQYNDRLKKNIEEYHKSPVEPAVPVNNAMHIGNGKGKHRLIIFNDFFCSFCYRLYKVEKHLMNKFENDIEYYYINYPLDSECNSYVKNSLYDNSCIAAKAMIAADKLGFFKEYLDEHFARYKEIKKNYSIDTAIAIFEQVRKDHDLAHSRQDFITLINSDETEKILQEHIETAKKYDVTGTPNMILNGKKLKGYRPKQFFDSVLNTD